MPGRPEVKGEAGGPAGFLKGPQLCLPSLGYYLTDSWPSVSVDSSFIHSFAYLRWVTTRRTAGPLYLWIPHSSTALLAFAGLPLEGQLALRSVDSAFMNSTIL